MSWKVKLSQEMTIETGDGQRYTPSWMGAVIAQEFNYTIFDFPNVSGSFVRRREPKGGIYNIEIYFQGENHLDVSEAFRKSAKVKKQWRILHPYYGELRVQPLRLVFDNRSYNISKITGRVMETIKGGLPVRAPSFTEEIEARSIALNEAAANDYADQVASVQASEVNLVSANVDVLEDTTEAIIQTDEEKISFRNSVIKAQNSVTQLVNVPINAIRDVQSVINFPSQIVAGVNARINVLEDQYSRLITSLGNITGLSRNNKVFATNSGATLIGSLAFATTTNMDYQSRQEVSDALTRVVDLFDAYIDDVDSFLTESQTQVDSYAASPDVLRSLSQLVNFTMANLQEIALDAKQEHIIITEADTNPVIMAHRVYGQDQLDENLDRFIETNNLGLRYLFNIPKDFEVKYYV